MRPTLLRSALSVLLAPGVTRRWSLPLVVVSASCIAAAQDAAPPAEQAPAAQSAGVDGDAPVAPKAPQPVDIGGPLRFAAADLQRAYALVGADKQAEDLVIPESEVKLALVQSIGAQALEARKLDVFLEREINERIQAGASAEAFAISDAELDEKVAELRAQVKEQYPTLEVDFVLGVNGIQPGSLRTVTHQGQLFQKVFLPDDPREWPPITRVAVTENMGEPFVEQSQTAYDRRVAEGVAEDAANAGQAMLRTMMRQLVVKKLEEQSEIVHADQGLPAGVALSVDDVQIMTEDVFREIADRVTEDDVRRARRWVAKRELMEQVLTAAGAWLDDEEFAAAYDEHEAPYRESSFPLELIARQFKRFPSMSAYRSHFRIVESFERMIAEEITPEVLEGHLARAARLLGMETVDAEVILLSAYDFPSGRWKPGGWQEAESRAGQVVAALIESGGERWGELLDAHSDFWDPPVSTAPGAQTPTDRTNKGRFGPRNRNTLVQALGESEFRMFVEGHSVADAIFFDVETGGVGGPWRGPYGYYIGHVKGRTPATQRVALEGERADLVRQDYVTVRLNAFGEQVARLVGLAAQG